MEIFRIQGKKPLAGTIEVRGSKNAASKMMIASLLTDERCTIENVPLSAEIDIVKELFETIGSDISFDEHTCHIATKEIATSLVPKLSRRNRIPILALGPLLHRRGVAEVPVVGGCYLGHRPINFHIEALTKMGVRIERRERSYYAESKEIHGAEIDLAYPSVGATENIILTASLAKGETIIRNAAIEPEIINMIKMLKGMGAMISVDAVAREISIQGVNGLHGVKSKVMPDRNEIVSFASAALATRGEIFIPDVAENYLTAFIDKVKEIGGIVEGVSGGIRFASADSYRGIYIETSTYPSFMTDWQQPFSVLLTQASGESIIHETVYEDRFGYVKELSRMGADITVSDECLGTPCRFAGQTFNHSARIFGPKMLRGVEIAMTDIRAGMAHIIAALSAEGESIISGIEHIDRGYERIDERLRTLGAIIERKSVIAG